MYQHSEVIRLDKHGAKITSVCTMPGETIACNQLIIAPGAWAGISIPVHPLRGQLLSLQTSLPSLNHIIFGDAAYISPRGNSVLVGATKEEAGFEIQTTEQGILGLYETATKFVPTLQESKREAAWAGLRPSTPDKRPILGAVPNWENVILATSHNSVGIILSPLTGKAIADLVVTGHSPEIIRPFSLARFQPQIGA